MVAPNDQLYRRTRVVHFRPYDAGSPDDRKAFSTVLAQLVQELPLPEPRLSWESLEPHVQDVFVGCLGCVGILKDWLLRSLQHVVLSGGEVVTWRAMEHTRRRDKALLAIAEQIREYRDYESGPCLSKVAESLGIPSGGGGEWDPPRPRRARAKPGKRLPKRDRAGLPCEAPSARRPA